MIPTKGSLGYNQVWSSADPHNLPTRLNHQPKEGKMQKLSQSFWTFTNLHGGGSFPNVLATSEDAAWAVILANCMSSTGDPNRNHYAVSLRSS